MESETQVAEAPGFTVYHQAVTLDIDPVLKSLRGHTTILVDPDSKDLKEVRLNFRQCRLNGVSINHIPPQGAIYNDPYVKLDLPYSTRPPQHEQIREKIQGALRSPPERELLLKFPKGIKIQEREDAPGKFSQVFIEISFSADNIRDGLHFVGWDPDDLRQPHIFTPLTKCPGSACSLFPCVDESNARCYWDITIKCPKTIGDCLKRKSTRLRLGTRQSCRNEGNSHGIAQPDEYLNSFNVEDKAGELRIVCSGDLASEDIDPEDPTKIKAHFVCATRLSPQQIGFAIGPFETLDLGQFRENNGAEKAGQGATPVTAWFLPGRQAEVENTCFPLARALDFLSVRTVGFPFSEYRLCFVDDAPRDIMHSGFLSICSNRLLFGADVIHPLDVVTRKLVHALASQWAGVNIIPREPEDVWVIVGISYYMTDLFLKAISGNNDHRFKQKKASDRVVDIDVHRPCLRDLGALLELDPTEQELMDLKAPLVLFILDQRLRKTGQSSVSRILTKIFTQARTGDLADAVITHSHFVRQCEKLSHTQLQLFFEQWTEQAGCPKFHVTQRFNKKKLVVEMP